MSYVEDGYVVAGYIGGPGSPVYFTLNGNTLPFGRSPLRPDRPLSYQQADIKSTGAERIGCDYYVKDDLIPLEWPRMSTWDKNRFIDWWKNVARAMANAFTYSDINGVQCTVRFDSPRLPEITEIAYDAWHVRCQLRVQ